MCYVASITRADISESEGKASEKEYDVVSVFIIQSPSL